MKMNAGEFAKSLSASYSLAIFHLPLPLYMESNPTPTKVHPSKRAGRQLLMGLPEHCILLGSWQSEDFPLPERTPIVELVPPFLGFTPPV